MKAVTVPAAYAGLFAIALLAGCQLIAYGNDDGGGRGGSTASSSSESTGAAIAASTSTGATCTSAENKNLGCTQACSDFCALYESKCGGDVNEYASHIGCCAMCSQFPAGDPANNTVECRTSVLGNAPANMCTKAGPYGGNVCGTDGTLYDTATAYCAICGGNNPKAITPNKGGQSLTKAAEMYGTNTGSDCVAAALCFCARAAADNGPPLLDSCNASACM